MLRNLVAIGASAGGLEALREIVAGLPGDFPAAILVTMHLSPRHDSQLDHILGAAGPLAASFARDGDRPQAGRVYLAPPDRHLLLEDDEIMLGAGPRENYARPSIDAMFRTVAACCGGRAVGVILTGTMDDGAAGLALLHRHSAITVVQDPADAREPELPQAAIAACRPHHIDRLKNIPAILRRLTATPAAPIAISPAALRLENEIARTNRAGIGALDHIGGRSVLTCPDCQGALWEIDDGNLRRYRCHVGHAYSEQLLGLALDENLRRALAQFQRGIDERIALARRALEDAQRDRRSTLTQTWTSRIAALEHERDAVRNAVQRIDGITASLAAEFESAASVETESEVKP